MIEPMRLKLFFCALLFCAITQAQTNAELKDFITKNSVALRSVQKNMLRENNASFIPVFKELLKKQESAVKLYTSNKAGSVAFAFDVRNECLSFLKKYAQGSTTYYEITESEKKYAEATIIKDLQALSDTEIKSIEVLDVMNPHSLNTITLTIQ